MRKLLPGILVVLFGFFWVLLNRPQTSVAQEEKTPYQIAYQSYLDQMQRYQSVHQEYVLRKSQYESFKTLQAQQDAQVATVKMLQERDEAVITYMKALRERILENPGLSENDKNLLFASIDTQVTWFTNHKQNIPTAGTLQDLAKDSRLANDQFNAAQGTFYKSLGYLSDGRFSDLKRRFADRFTELKTKIEVIKRETREEYAFSTEKILRLDRWVFDAQSRMARSDEKQLEAQKVIQLFGTNNRAVKNLPGAYSGILVTLGDGQIYLKESGGYLQEIIRDIKTAED